MLWVPLPRPPSRPNVNSSQGNLRDSSATCATCSARTAFKGTHSQPSLFQPQCRSFSTQFLLRVIRAANGSVCFVGGSIASAPFQEKRNWGDSQAVRGEEPVTRGAVVGDATYMKCPKQTKPLLTPRPCTCDAGKPGRNTFSKTGLSLFMISPC